MTSVLDIWHAGSIDTIQFEGQAALTVLKFTVTQGNESLATAGMSDRS